MNAIRRTSAVLCKNSNAIHFLHIEIISKKNESNEGARTQMQKEES